MTQPLRRIVPAQPHDPPEPREDCAACRAKDIMIEALQARIEALTIAVQRESHHIDKRATPSGWSFVKEKK